MRLFKGRKKKIPAPRSLGAVMAAERAPHNPRQQLITADEAGQRTATELVAEAGVHLPALTQAMSSIAARYEGLARNLDALNRGLGEFKHEVMLPFREELKYLRYTTGDRLNHVSADLETYVSKLDKVLWAALRAQGLSDTAIRQFREEQGMQPEAPRGFELEAHIREVEGMKETIARLTEQNRRLIAGGSGHIFGRGVTAWVFHPNCQCEVCKTHREQVQAAEAEAAG